VSVADEVAAAVAEISKTLPDRQQARGHPGGGKEAASSLNNVIESLVFGPG